MPVTNKWQTLSDSRLVYYLANGQQARGDQTVDGVQLHFNNSGVPDNGGWDFTDYQYVAKMRQQRWLWHLRLLQLVARTRPVDL